MLEEIISHFTNGNKAQFANKLGVTAQTISAWISRKTFDNELIFTKCCGINPEWLLSGKPPMLLSKSGKDSSSANQSTESQDMETEENKPMTTDERFDALIMQNDALIQSVQEAFKVIASHQRQAETNQEIMKQLLSMLNDSKKNNHTAVSAQGIMHQMVYD